MYIDKKIYRGVKILMLRVIGLSILLCSGYVQEGSANMEQSQVHMGQVYVSAEEVKLLGIASIKGGSSTGFRCVIPKGEKIVLTNTPPPQATAVWAMPLNYSKLEGQIVPSEIKQSPSYTDYGINIDLSLLGKAFTLEQKAEIIFDNAATQKEWDLILKYNPEEANRIKKLH